MFNPCRSHRLTLTFKPRSDRIPLCSGQRAGRYEKVPLYRLDPGYPGQLTANGGTEQRHREESLAKNFALAHRPIHSSKRFIFSFSKTQIHETLTTITSRGERTDTLNQEAFAHPQELSTRNCDDRNSIKFKSQLIFNH